MINIKTSAKIAPINLRKRGFLRMFKKALLTGVLSTSVLLSSQSFAMDQETVLAITGLQERFDRVVQMNEQLLKDIRDLQRNVDHLYKMNEEKDKKIADLLDQTLKIENVELSNIKAGQKGLYDQVPSFTWGQSTKDCDSIGSKHQQIEMVKSEDGSRTLRFLCFDGKAIHLGTEINTPPQ